MRCPGRAASGAFRRLCSLLLLHREDAHGACLGAQAAGNALAWLGVFRLGHDHYLHGASLDALAAANALALVDHIHALSVLRDGSLGAGPGALAAHDAILHLGLAIGLSDNADAAEIRIKLLIKRLGTGPNAAQARLTGICFTDYQLFHMRMTSCCLMITPLSYQMYC